MLTRDLYDKRGLWLLVVGQFPIADDIDVVRSTIGRILEADPNLEMLGRCVC
jgi:hypothetical protein